MRINRVGYAVLVAIVGGGCYINSLGNGFVFDDPAYIGHRVIRQFALGDIFLERWLQLELYRPLTLLSLASDFRLYGEAPGGYHLSNLLLHAVNCALFYLFGAQVLGKGPAALWAALFYAVHPLQSDVVNWVAARGDLLMQLFLLVGLLCHSRGGRWWGKIAWFCCAASLLSKENGILMPVLAWWYDFCLGEGRGIGWSRYIWTWGRRHFAYGIVVVVVLGWRLMVGAEGEGPESTNFLAAVELPQRLMTIFSIFMHYLVLMAFPLRLSADYSNASIPVVATALDPWFIGGIVGVCVLGYLFWRAPRGNISFAAGWFWASLLPVSNLFFLPPSAMAERYLYLALIPLALVFGLAVNACLQRWMPPWRYVGTGLALLVLLGYAGRTVWRNGDWRSDGTLFAAVLAHYPNNVRAHENLGGALFQRGRLQEARAHYQRAIAINPSNVRSFYNLGLLHGQLRQYEAAIQAYQAALRLQPQHTDSHYGLGLVLQKTGRYQAAVPHYRAVLEQMPDHFGAAYNLARAYQRLQRHQAALQQFAVALELNPQTAKIYYHLGGLYRQMGRQTEMVQAWKTLLRLAPNHAEAGKIRSLLEDYTSQEE